MEPFSGAFTIDIRRLRVLRELRRRGTIGATAKVLALTPSAISQQLSALSRELGVPLLAPDGRRVRLTQQAELLLEHATAIDAQLERARADLAAYEQGAVGRVTLGAFATAITGLVAPMLEHLRHTLPRIRLGIRENGPESLALLDRGELDVVVTVDHPNGMTRGDCRYRRWELLDDHLLIALPRGHRLAARRSIDLVELAAEPWIVGGAGGPCHQVGAAACMAAGFAPDVVHEMDDWGALLRLVAGGCGVGLVPELAVAHRPPPDVVLRAPAGAHRPSRHIYAAVRAGAEGSPCIGPVIDALTTVARELVASSSAAEGPSRSRNGGGRRRRSSARA